MTGDIVLFSKLKDGIFKAQSYEENGMLGSEKTLVAFSQIVSFSDWHKAFGHVSTDTIDSASSIYASATKTYQLSLSWLLSLKEYTPPRSHTHLLPNLLNLSNLIFLESSVTSVQSLGKAFYYMTFIDDYTRYTWAHILRSKDQAVQVIKDFLAMVKRRFNAEIKCFRSDGGGEYVEIKNTFAEEGITHQVTPPCSPESNGVAERFNRTLKEMIRTWLGSIEKYFLWAEAVNTAVYIKNRLPHKALSNSTSNSASSNSATRHPGLKPRPMKHYSANNRQSHIYNLLVRSYSGGSAQIWILAPPYSCRSYHCRIHGFL